jgi:hypothetical protein
VGNFSEQLWGDSPERDHYWILLLGLVVLPVAAMLLVLAWVQPAERHVALCMVLGVAALPFVIWFAGRADEYLSEAIISGGVVATIVVALSLIRNRGRRDREMAGAELPLCATDRPSLWSA